MFDDLVYDFVIFNKGNNSHGSSAFGTDERIDLIDLLYHLSPSFLRYKWIFIFKEIIERGVVQEHEIAGGKKTIIKNVPLKNPKENEFRFDGKVYLLTGSETFSSAGMFASAFQCFNMGEVIGRETGGLTVSFGDKYNFVLPNTRLNAGVSFKKFYGPCGKEDHHGVIPDFVVKFEKIQKDDIVLEFTKDLIMKIRSRREKVCRKYY